MPGARTDSKSIAVKNGVMLSASMARSTEVRLSSWPLTLGNGRGGSSGMGSLLGRQGRVHETDGGADVLGVPEGTDPDRDGEALGGQDLLGLADRNHHVGGVAVEAHRDLVGHDLLDLGRA